MIQIVGANAAHAGVLAALHSRCFEKPWNKKAFTDLLNVPGMIALIVQKNDTPAGFILAQSVDGEAEIITIGVSPEFQRMGFASGLINAILEASPELTKLFIEVDKSNENARSFYTQVGFFPNGRRKNYYHHDDGTKSDALMMVLAPPARA